MLAKLVQPARWPATPGDKGPPPRCPQNTPAPHSCEGQGALLAQAGNEQGEHSPSPEQEIPTPRLV